MQDPSSGELHPVPNDDLTKVPPRWRVYELGQRVKFNGWYWEVTGINIDGQGELTVKPVRKDSMEKYRKKRRPKRK